MELNIGIILNVMIGMFLYNAILKSIGVSILKYMIKTKAGNDASEEVKKSFREKLGDEKK